MGRRGLDVSPPVLRPLNRIDVNMMTWNAGNIFVFIAEHVTAIVRGGVRILKLKHLVLLERDKWRVQVILGELT